MVLRCASKLLGVVNVLWQDGQCAVLNPLHFEPQRLSACGSFW